jgi:cell division initiation protein
MRGFDPVEVTALLTAVADDYEGALREADRLKQDVSRMEVMLAEHRDAEKNLKVTLIAAQKLANDIKAQAESEARRILEGAEQRAAILVDKAQLRVEDVQREIDGLKLKRKDAETAVEATIQALRNTLEFVREQDEREREERVMLRKVIGVILEVRVIPRAQKTEFSGERDGRIGRASRRSAGRWRRERCADCLPR